MLNRAMEMIDKLKETFLWFHYQMAFAIFAGVIGITLVFQHLMGDENAVVSWGFYFKVLNILVIPNAIVLFVRFLHAINYIIFGEDKE